MSYRYDSEIVILNRLSKASVEAKSQLFQTYDELRDLTVSGPSIGGSGLGTVSNYLFKFAQFLSGSSFLPTLGNQSINIPGTSYFSPIAGGTGINPGGQSSFGLGPMAQTLGLPSAGSAAKIDALSILGQQGFGSIAGQAAGLSGIGDLGYDPDVSAIGGFGSEAGQAAQLGTAGRAASAGAGLVAAAGFGRNLVVPSAGILSGIGGMLTSLAPIFGNGQSGLAALAGGTILSGISGAVLDSYQHVSNRIITNADVILSNKIKNLETTVKMLDAQQDIVKKLLKEGIDGDKKALNDL
ncbi:MAG: hypothetical protein KC475_10105 [Cyanobacteria bacterium HKST-UBA03]|nr:hypothetical protein [Cyanobacteria bacterium HKST-UBA03]